MATSLEGGSFIGGSVDRWIGIIARSVDRWIGRSMDR